MKMGRWTSLVTVLLLLLCGTACDVHPEGNDAENMEASDTVVHTDTTTTKDTTSAGTVTESTKATTTVKLSAGTTKKQTAGTTPKSTSVTSTTTTATRVTETTSDKIKNPLIYHAATPAEKVAQPNRYKPAWDYSNSKEVEAETLRDPCIIREGDYYYLVNTIYPFCNNTDRDETKPELNSSPGIFLYRSRNLVDWEPVDWLLKSSELPEDCPYKHRFWAPEIHKIDGRFYLIFTADNWVKPEYNRTGKNGLYAFIGVADSVEGPYTHITEIVGAGCDTSLFEDVDGKTYVLIPGTDIHIQPIDLTGIDEGRVTLYGERVKVVTADNSDIGLSWNFHWLEGPFMIRQNNRYYLFFAGTHNIYENSTESGTSGLGNEYWSGVAYADSPTGPFQKDPNGRVLHTGHMAVFTGPDGTPWASYRGEQKEDFLTYELLNVKPILFDTTGAVVKDSQ